MARRMMLVVLAVALTMLLAGCGQTYEVVSISATPPRVALSSTTTSQQFKITATYSNTKTEDVTTQASYSMTDSTASTAPLDGISYNNAGLVSLTATPSCTYTTSTASNPYTLNVSYSNNGKTVTTSAYIDVNNSSTCP